MTNKEWLFAQSTLDIAEAIQKCPPPLQGNSCGGVSPCKICWAKWLEAEHEEPLKPCPFCGGSNITTFGAGLFPAYVRCEDCTSIVFDNELQSTIENAIKKWNRRANDE